MHATTKALAPLAEIKALTDEGELEGYASVFDVEDQGGDTVAPGAYLASLAKHKAAGRMPRMLWQHDPSQPIGRWSDMREDGRGLKVRGRLNMGVQAAREAHALLKAGDIDGLSIGYRTVRAERDEDAGTRVLKEVDLWEVSVVTFPMNQAATATAVKAAREAEALTEKLAAGDRLTEREFETLLKGALGLTNSQAERAARVHLKGPGEPAAADPRAAFLRALRA